MRYFLIILIQLFYVMALNAGAWPQEKGRWFLKLSGSYLDAAKEFDFKGRRTPILSDFGVYKNVHYLEKTAALYLEYGLTNQLTIRSEILWKAATSLRTEISNYFGERELRDTRTGFGDWRNGIQFHFLNGQNAVSLQIGAKLPLGYPAISTSPAPVLGNGEKELEIKALAGHSLYPVPFYISAGAGYRFCSGKLADELLAEGEAGLSMLKVFLKIYMEFVKSRGVIPDLYGHELQLPLPGGGGALPEVLYGNQEYLKILPSIEYSINGSLALQIEYIKTLAGKNIVDGGACHFALIFHF